MESEYTNDEYTIGWICALQEEFDVATAMFTEEHGLPQSLPKEDNNAYMLGQIGHHKVVMACLPVGRMGTNPAAVVADSMRRTFKSLRFGLLVGIGGGAPKPFVGKDVRLGDVVVSVPKGAYGGVVQYDFRKLEAGKNGFTHRGHLCSPPEKLLTNQSWGELSDEYEYPAVGDKLFQSDYIHDGSKAVGSGSFATDDCAHCDEGKLITGRKQRKDNIPVVHLGTIASGNFVIKDATVRDYIDECYDNTVLCFEMEAAGLMNTFPCPVVRGISDYADSHKNDGWRNRAIAAASVYAKALITIISPEDVVELPKVNKLMAELTLTVKGVSEDVAKVSEQVQEDREERDRKQILDWITSIDYDSQLSDIVKKSQECTGRWLLDSPEYQNWANGGKQILYCPGIPGAGKTVLTSIIIHDLLDRFSGTSGFGLALLRQLAGRCSPLPSEVKQLCSTNYSRKTRPREAEIVTTLRAITKLFTKSFIIVDALDECQKADGCRTKFLNILFDIQKEVCISILATSRSDGDISRFF
ncbi:hypothetical protein AOL_s00173g2 [Orbilia oligospora ATCC 24927]|uniref:Nephrocystin 3-like N-terminal domain-containing protein n=1 Tax=Arthrobotrys oligospora (strain ATCC 24927 / CBS 115.81 / DSM 1491) TaxID=756982 RepID=G1XNI4_ARTOA|nr:hypothetical protein AOL_s00173g2 [Orbilia oligospora ATCC 24927]EGX44901.1 hypothetical protein AOL_s00173g2 [Orbilia oligospora ATCC 24927]